MLENLLFYVFDNVLPSKKYLDAGDGSGSQKNEEQSNCLVQFGKNKQIVELLKQLYEKHLKKENPMLDKGVTIKEVNNPNETQKQEKTQQTEQTQPQISKEQMDMLFENDSLLKDTATLYDAFAHTPSQTRLKEIDNEKEQPDTFLGLDNYFSI